VWRQQQQQLLNVIPEEMTQILNQPMTLSVIRVKGQSFNANPLNEGALYENFTTIGSSDHANENYTPAKL